MPLRNQAKLTIWDALKHYAAAVLGVQFNEADLMIRYPNGNKLQLFGADNPDALRGPGFSGLSRVAGQAAVDPTDVDPAF